MRPVCAAVREQECAWSDSGERPRRSERQGPRECREVPERDRRGQTGRVDAGEGDVLAGRAPGPGVQLEEFGLLARVRQEGREALGRRGQLEDGVPLLLDGERRRRGGQEWVLRTRRFRVLLLGFGRGLRERLVVELVGRLQRQRQRNAGLLLQRHGLCGDRRGREGRGGGRGGVAVVEVSREGAGGHGLSALAAEEQLLGPGGRVGSVEVEVGRREVRTRLFQPMQRLEGKGTLGGHWGGRRGGGGRQLHQECLEVSPRSGRGEVVFVLLLRIGLRRIRHHS